jgi:ferritin
MVSKKMEKALNEQLTKEMYSSHLYLSMAAYFESLNWPGFGTWMKIQAQEEMGHAMKIYGYLNGQNGRVLLAGLDAPETEWKSPLEAFKAANKHEQFITASINELMALAIDEKDFATQAFLQWFVTEQVEEEASTQDVVDKLTLIKDAPQGMFMLDRALAQRGAGA